MDDDTEEVVDPRIGEWLDEGPDVAPFAFVEATLAPIPAMAQRRRSVVALGRLSVRVATLARAAAIVALAVAATVLGASLLSRPPGIGGSTPAPSPIATPIAYADEAGGGTAASHSRAGTYQTRQFRPRLVFTVPDGWNVTNVLDTFVGGGESQTGFPISDGIGEIVVTSPTSVDPPAPGEPGAIVPADLLAWLRADPSLALGPAEPVTIGGIAGRQVEGTLAAGARIDPAEGFYRPFDALPLVPRFRFRIAVVVVHGQQLVVATAANADAFPEFAARADAIIASFTFPGD